MTSEAETLRILIAESDLADGVLIREFISVANLGRTDIRQAGSLSEAIAALDEDRCRYEKLRDDLDASLDEVRVYYLGTSHLRSR